jgi:hypothetical protein
MVQPALPAHHLEAHGPVRQEARKLKLRTPEPDSREHPIMAVKHRSPDRCGRPLNFAFRSSGLELPVCVVLPPVDRRPRTPARDSKELAGLSGRMPGLALEVDFRPSRQANSAPFSYHLRVARVPGYINECGANVACSSPGNRLSKKVVILDASFRKAAWLAQRD